MVTMGSTTINGPKGNPMATTKQEPPLSAGEKHAARLGFEPRTSASGRTADRLAEQAGEGDPSWPDTLRVLADATAARRAEDYARFLAASAARNRPRVDPQIAAKQAAGTTRGRIADEMVKAEAEDRAAEAAAAAEFRRAEAEARRAQPATGKRNGPTPPPPAKWEQDEARARLAQLADDAA